LKIAGNEALTKRYSARPAAVVAGAKSGVWFCLQCDSCSSDGARFDSFATASASLQSSEMVRWTWDIVPVVLYLPALQAWTSGCS